MNTHNSQVDVVSVDGVSLQYVHAGSRRNRWMFIVPPFHTDVERIGPLIDELSRKYFVVFPQLPGIVHASSLPPGYDYTSSSYAQLLAILIAHLNPRSYDLFAISLGGIIAISLLRLKIKKPSRIIIYGMPYAHEYIHPEFPQRLGVSLFAFFRRIDSVGIWFMKYVYCNPVILAIIFGIRYIGAPHYVQTIKTQIRLTAGMNPHAIAGILSELMTLDLRDNSFRCSLPIVLVYNKHDSIFDVAPTVRGVQTLFPRSRVVLLPGYQHAPPGKISTQDLRIMLKHVTVALAKHKYKHRANT